MKYDVGFWPNFIAYPGGENRQPEIRLCLQVFLFLIALKMFAEFDPDKTELIKRFELTSGSTLKLQ